MMKASSFSSPLTVAVILSQLYWSHYSLAWIPTFTPVPTTRSSFSESKSLVRRGGICSTNLSASTGTGTAQSPSISTSTDAKYINFGILISSFTEGILTDYVVEDDDGAMTMVPMTAAEYFQYSLLSLLTMDKIRTSQDEIEESVKFSPCQGPNIDSLEQLEKGDDIMDNEKNASREERIKLMMDYLRNDNENGMNGDSANGDSNSHKRKPMEIKVVYIPTAMYALRADSQNTPGKQRQRARADGKKRRDQLVRFIEDMFASQSDGGGGYSRYGGSGLDVNVLAVTLDLDDGSIKQPYNGAGEAAAAAADNKKSIFPNDGKEALTTWNPHLLYVEGGNTFWLHYCMNKGDEDWSRLITDACCVAADDDFDSNDNDELRRRRRPALYVGKSAGAIVAGKYVETATWKGWDDPSIVPGLETYDNWKGTLGLDFAGGISIFPHMSEDWVELVSEKRGTVNGEVGTLYEWEGCCIEGSTNEVFISDFNTKPTRL